MASLYIEKIDIMYNHLNLYRIFIFKTWQEEVILRYRSYNCFVHGFVHITSTYVRHVVTFKGYNPWKDNDERKRRSRILVA